MIKLNEQIKFNIFSFTSTFARSLIEIFISLYLLSNTNPYTHEFICNSELLNIVDGFVFSYQEHQIKPYVGIYNTLIDRYALKPLETLFIDDNQKNIDTGNKIGFISKKVEPDNYDSIISVIEKLNLL